MADSVMVDCILEYRIDTMGRFLGDTAAANHFLMLLSYARYDWVLAVKLCLKIDFPHCMHCTH